MFEIAHRIPTVTHPMIQDLYLKSWFGRNGQGEQILIIDTADVNLDKRNHQSNSEFMDLLMDLKDIQQEVEDRFGPIDRIDIRTH